MTIYVNAWCAVHYTTQDFTVISEIGQLHKKLGSRSCHFGLFFSTFAWARVFMVCCRVRRLLKVPKIQNSYTCMCITVSAGGSGNVPAGKMRVCWNRQWRRVAWRWAQAPAEASASRVDVVMKRQFHFFPPDIYMTSSSIQTRRCTLKGSGSISSAFVIRILWRGGV